MNFCVGNLPFEISESELRNEFASYGTVDSVKLITDRETGRPHRFAFLEMADDGEARQAIEALEGKDVRGRSLKVNEARPRR